MRIIVCDFCGKDTDQDYSKNYVVKPVTEGGEYSFVVKFKTNRKRSGNTHVCLKCVVYYVVDYLNKLLGQGK
jgi:hypothetical protein